MATNSLLIVFAQQSKGTAFTLQGLDAALTAAILGVKTDLVFMGAGVNALCDTSVQEKIKTILGIGSSQCFIPDTVNSEFLKLSVAPLPYLTLASANLPEIFHSYAKTLSF